MVALAEDKPISHRCPQITVSDEDVNDFTPLPTVRALNILLDFCLEFKLDCWYEGEDADGKRVGAKPTVPFKEALLQTLVVSIYLGRAVCTCTFAQFVWYGSRKQEHLFRATNG